MKTNQYENRTKKLTTRNSNIELLRIVSMFFIVAGHFVGQSGTVHYSFTVNDFILNFLSSGSRVAVNVFLIIGVWYMVDSMFSAERIMQTYFNVIFFSIPITIIMICTNYNNIQIKEIMCGIFPFLLRGVWFASAYITLMLFKPFLDKILAWEKEQLVPFIVLLIIFVSFISTISHDSQGYVLDSIWFLIVYLIIGFIKKYQFKGMIHNNIIAIGGVDIFS